MTTDEALMLEFQKGSSEAFEELFSRYRERIYGYFRRRLQHPSRAEELAQEAFLAVLKGVERYEPRALFRTYLYAIAMNLIAAERRKAGREISGANAAHEPAAPAESEASFGVREGVARLDANDREVLLLREYEQLSYEEIAVVLRLPLNTVRSRLFRARVALREILLEKAPKPEAQP
jgi:RNA polymerase sigma-70 factor (ECF subfamily)